MQIEKIQERKIVDATCDADTRAQGLASAWTELMLKSV